VHLKFSNGLPVSDNTILAYKGTGETGTGWIRPVGVCGEGKEMGEGRARGSGGEGRGGEKDRRERAEMLYLLNLFLPALSPPSSPPPSPKGWDGITAAIKTACWSQMIPQV
jgi:hypothetical protein